MKAREGLAGTWRGATSDLADMGVAQDHVPGKLLRSAEAHGPSPTTQPGATVSGPSDGLAPAAGIDDWEMTPELTAALGLHEEASTDAVDHGTTSLRATEPHTPTNSEVEATATHGVANAKSPLPHQDQIQRSFGRYDIGGVRAQVGAEAAEASGALGADAYATGDRVAFAKPPDLHTAAHEAAHVVQQRAGVSLKGGLGLPGDRHEQHADAVAELVVQGKSAERLLSQQAGPTMAAATSGASQSVQASFLSFAVKMGAKKASKAMLQKFIKEQIKAKINKIAIKRFATKFSKEADDLISILDDPWWITGIGFIPLVGDAFDLVHVPKQIAKAMKAADRLEEKVKAILHMQGRRASELIPSTLQRSQSYASELADKTYAELIQLAGSSERAAKMKKLIENEARLMEKL